MTGWEVLAAGPDDRTAVRDLVLRLLSEICPDAKEGYTAAKLEPVTKQVLEQSGDVFAFLAFAADGRPVGIILINRCTAIYALGDFGEITELYVDPAFRSSGLGEALIAAARQLGSDQGWSVLEVGAPSQPRWQRSVDFYVRNGFEVIGPRLYLTL